MEIANLIIAILSLIVVSHRRDVISTYKIF